MNLINELRMLAEDLHVNGYNGYSEAMSKAADELGSLERYRTAYNEWVDKTEWVQADTSLPAKYLGMHRADVLKDMISELLDRLEAAESARRDDYQNWMTALDRNAELLAKLEAAEKERDNARMLADRLALALNTSNHERDAAELMSLALRATVEQMEKQEPMGTLHDDGCFVWRETAPHQSNYAGWKMVLYALPGAQGEEK